GQTVGLQPKVSLNNDVIWVCGYKAPPPNAQDPASGAAPAPANTLPQKYLPQNCRA
ncbi:MAG: hypothetical protein JSR54_09475, partial [Proteobacteria bacterium]|nr:hypothetical protein [Pseudomonadota bacterium]